MLLPDLLGNDIVDLHPQNLKCWDNPAYMQRVMTPKERDWLDDHKTEGLPAMLFACKESAYKHFVKRGRHKAFHPRSFDVTLSRVPGCNTDQSLRFQGTVSCEDQACNCTVHFVPHRYTHALSFRSEDPKTVTKIRCTNNLSERRMIAMLISKDVFENLAAGPIDVTEAAIVHDPITTIPFLVIGGKKIDIDLTISHDGPYLAWAYSLTNLDCTTS